MHKTNAQPPPNLKSFPKAITLVNMPKEICCVETDFSLDDKIKQDFDIITEFYANIWLMLCISHLHSA